MILFSSIMLYILLLVIFGRGAEGHLIHTCLKKLSENQGAESAEEPSVSVDDQPTV